MKFIIPLILLSLMGFSLNQETQAQNTSSTTGPAKTLSPAERRAFVRDSLRQERLKARVTTEEVTTPRPATTPATNPATTPTATATATATPTPTTTATATPTSSTPAVTPPIPPVVALPGTSKASLVVTPLATPVVEDPVATSSAKASIELPISDTLMVKSLSVRSTEIRDVLQGLGMQFGLNLILAPEVAGPISVNLSQIKLKSALQLIAEENGYVLSVVHGAIKVEKRPAPKVAPPPQPRFIVQYAGDKLTLDFQKTPNDQVVRKLVETTGKNIFLDANAAGDMNAFFKDMDLLKGLKTLAETNGLALKEKDGSFTFYREAWNTTPSKDGSMAKGKMRITVKDKRLSLELAGASLADVISAISDQSNIGTVVYGELKGSVTMRISDVPLEQAFQILFRGTEFTFWIHSGIYFIGPQSMQVLNNSKLIVLKHLKVDDVMDLLPQALIKDAQLKAVKSQNAIMAMGTYETLDGITQYINQIDLPVPQILIEALVVDVDIDRARQYGVDLFMGDFKKVGSTEHIYPNIDQVFNRDRSQDILNAIPGVRDIITLPKNFVAKIEALEQEKTLKIRSRPQIATLNGSEATITVGQTQYFLLKSETDFNQTGTTTSKTTERFEKIEANVTLTVTPFVTGKGEVTCDIVPDFSEPEGSFDSRTPPTLNRRTLKSKVRLRDGETIVLGGLVKESINRTSRQVPFLGSIPIIGWLFKNVSSVKSRSQLMIFVTPHVYYGNDSKVDPNQYLKQQSDLE